MHRLPRLTAPRKSAVFATKSALWRPSNNELEIKLIEWDLEGIFVFLNDQGQHCWAQANDVRWRSLLNQSLKQQNR